MFNFVIVICKFVVMAVKTVYVYNYINLSVLSQSYTTHYDRLLA